MRHATILLLLLLVGLHPAFAQQKNLHLQQEYGPNYEEILNKYGDNPQALQQAADLYRASLLRPASRMRFQADSPYVLASESEPNDFFNTANSIDDVLNTQTPWADVAYYGGLIEASFTAGDFDVYSFTIDPNKMYYFGATHSFAGTENYDEDRLGVSLRLFHESDLDTTFVEGFGGIDGNDQIRGDILGRPTDHRANSGDFRLTGWTAPIDPDTGEKLTGTYYLFIYNGEEGGSQRPIKSLDNTGTYHFSAYAIDLEPWVSKFEPNQTFEEALLNPEATLEPDAVVRNFMAFNPDTIKAQITAASGLTFDELPYQANSQYPKLLAQGDEDIDHFRIDGLKANHTLVVETLPFFGYYREADGSMGPGNPRWTDPRIRLYNADYTDILAEDDDAGRETQTTSGSPNNIHSRIVYPVQNGDVGAPLWVWVGAWASNTRTLSSPGGAEYMSVDNRDPGRFMYKFYVHQYANDPDETAFEPENNTADGAMGIIERRDDAIDGTFTGAGDVDYFRLYMNETRMYSLVSFNSTVSSPIQIEIFHESEDGNGGTTLSGDLLAGTSAVGALGNDFRVGGFIPPASGAYLIKLTGPGAGNYKMAVFEDQVFNRLVRNEPDDVLADASGNDAITIGVGAPRQEGIIFPAGDVDHYRFTGVAGQQVTLKLQAVASSVVNADFEAELALLDDGGSVIATGSPSADAFSQLTATLSENGTYYIQIQAAGGTEGDYGDPNVGMYSLNVGEPVREIEPNNTPANATVLLNGFIAGTVAPGDVDYYRIPTEEGHIYHIRQSNSDLSGALNVDLVTAADPNTSLHDGSDWQGRYGDNQFKVQLLPSADTEYLLRLEWPATQAAGGNYEIHIKSTNITTLREVYEPNDGIGQVAAEDAIEPDGEIREAMLYNAGNAAEDFAYDVDYYRVDIREPGKTLVCETIPYDGEFWSRDTDMYMELYDSAGTLLADDDDGGFDWHSKISYQIDTAGTYYCAIHSQDAPDNDTDRDPTTAEYKFQISYSTDEAESNDTFATATALTPQGTTNATFGEGDAVDIFSIAMEAGYIYHIRTLRGEGMGEFSDATFSTAAAPGTDITDTETGGWRTRNNSGNIKLNVIPETDQTYYLQINAPADLGDGTYQVLVKATPLDPFSTEGEPNNTFDEADAQGDHVAGGIPMEYMLYDPSVDGYHDDIDIYRITVDAGDEIVGETMPFNGPVWPRDFDGYMYLYGPDRQIIADDDDGGYDWHSKITHVATENGPHYFMVIGQDAAVPPRNQTESRWRDPARGEYKFAITVNGEITVDTEQEAELPGEFVLHANYPNPFNPVTTINYALPMASDVSVRVYNILGQEVTTLVSTYQQAGTHTVHFDGTGMASGLYFYRMEAGTFSKTQKMMLVK